MIHFKSLLPFSSSLSCSRQRGRHLPTWSTWSVWVRGPQTFQSLWGLTLFGRACRSNFPAPSRAVHPQRSHGENFSLLAFTGLQWFNTMEFSISFFFPGCAENCHGFNLVSSWLEWLRRENSQFKFSKVQGKIAQKVLVSESSDQKL